MKTIFAQTALLENGWADRVEIKISNNGLIEEVISDTNRTSDIYVDILLPAPVNAHSHAFQRAMAGLTERRGPNGSDSFWTWRKLMFRFLNQLKPKHIEKICALVQMEMLEAGFATNVEFHYLHHQPGGQQYSKLSEMSSRICSATLQSGIGLTIIPALYQYGGCDKSELREGQVRFRNSVDQYLKLFQEVNDMIKNMPDDTNTGLSAHSLRAVGKAEIIEISKFAGDRPLHMHVAEQAAEVEEVFSAWGKRPVEWILENLPINPRWCLIHCTHMLPDEILKLSTTGAVVGLCPITEANLGDGIFDAVKWLNIGGNVAIGSDSNIIISLAEEIRSLEYSQRLRDHSRASLATNNKSTGRRIFDAILHGGARASGRNTGKIAVGQWADLLSIDSSNINLLHSRGDSILDSFIFTSKQGFVENVWSAGRHMVKSGRHIARESITENYIKVIKELVGLI